MCYQAALTVDNVAVARLADLDRLDDVPHQLQVDIGHGDTAAAALRHRHGEIGLAAFAECDRPVIDLVCLGFDESWLGRPIDVAADYVHGEAGDDDLLVPLPVE